MAFDEESMLDVKVAVVENLSRKIDVNEAYRSFERHFGEPVNEMKPSNYLGIVLVDGMCGLEEKLMDVIGDKTNVLFIGGSAGDDLKFQSTHVFANGKSYTDAAVLALLKPAAPFELVKTQSVRELGAELVVTKANEDQREIVEFNHKPAAKPTRKPWECPSMSWPPAFRATLSVWSLMGSRTFGARRRFRVTAYSFIAAPLRECRSRCLN